MQRTALCYSCNQYHEHSRNLAHPLSHKSFLRFSQLFKKQQGTIPCMKTPQSKAKQHDSFVSMPTAKKIEKELTEVSIPPSPIVRLTIAKNNSKNYKLPSNSRLSSAIQRSGVSNKSGASNKSAGGTLKKNKVFLMNSSQTAAWADYRGRRTQNGKKKNINFSIQSLTAEKTSQSAKIKETLKDQRQCTPSFSSQKLPAYESPSRLPVKQKAKIAGNVLYGPDQSLLTVECEHLSDSLSDPPEQKMLQKKCRLKTEAHERCKYEDNRCLGFNFCSMPVDEADTQLCMDDLA